MPVFEFVCVFVLVGHRTYMVKRVDKCSTLAIKKQLTKSIQYLPKLFINNHLIPRIEMGKSFCYLGRHFNYDMSDEEHKTELLDMFDDILSKIYQLPLHGTSRFLIYPRPGSAKH